MLESVKNEGCDSGDSAHLTLVEELSGRVARLEERLNFTLNQNKDLRRQLQYYVLNHGAAAAPRSRRQAEGGQPFVPAPPPPPPPPLPQQQPFVPAPPPPPSTTTALAATNTIPQ